MGWVSSSRVGKNFESRLALNDYAQVEVYFLSLLALDGLGQHMLICILFPG
jgi:hypothetical protein